MLLWLRGVLHAHPEIAFFLVLGIGYLLGKLALRSFKLGAVTGTLLAGVLVGQLGVTLPNEVKQCFFLLFLFAIVAVTGLLAAYAVSRAFGYDAGGGAGLVAG
jgi:putative transport protein